MCGRDIRSDRGCYHRVRIMRFFELALTLYNPFLFRWLRAVFRVASKARISLQSTGIFGVSPLNRIFSRNGCNRFLVSFSWLTIFSCSYLISRYPIYFLSTPGVGGGSVFRVFSPALGVGEGERQAETVEQNPSHENSMRQDGVINCKRQGMREQGSKGARGDFPPTQAELGWGTRLRYAAHRRRTRRLGDLAAGCLHHLGMGLRLGVTIDAQVVERVIDETRPRTAPASA